MKPSSLATPKKLTFAAIVAEADSSESLDDAVITSKRPRETPVAEEDHISSVPPIRRAVSIILHFMLRPIDSLCFLQRVTKQYTSRLGIIADSMAQTPTAKTSRSKVRGSPGLPSTTEPSAAKYSRP